VGGGPAGCAAALALRRAGRPVTLFQGARPAGKPCGGGATLRAFGPFPLRRVVPLEPFVPAGIVLLSPRGRRAEVPAPGGFALYPRAALDEALLDAARRAGAEVVRERVTAVARAAGAWLVGGRRFGFVVGSAGAGDPVRRAVGLGLDPREHVLALHYLLPRAPDPRVFLRYRARPSGYLWYFPKAGSASIGALAPLAGRTASELDREVRAFAAAILPPGSLAGARRQSAPIPAPTAAGLDRLAVEGDGWALAGDAAGLADPITGEGIYAALVSGDLLGRSLAKGGSYTGALGLELVPELRRAARYRRWFYAGPLLEAQVALVARGGAVAALFGELVSGAQPYGTLRTRLLRILGGAFGRRPLLRPGA
jgi:flavin-dependent dehydrogenase